MKSVIFIAPPFAGKGTFSEYLVENFGYKHISTGRILREKALHDESLRNLLDSGDLVSDELIMDIIREELLLLKENEPFILDGVPRTLQQAKKLDIILSGLKRHDFVVIYIDVDKEILQDRVVGRRICPKCHRTFNVNADEFKPLCEGLCDDCDYPLTKRGDDNLESFQNRYQNFLESIFPLVSFYKEKECLKVLKNSEVDQTEALKQLLEVLDVNQK